MDAAQLLKFQAMAERDKYMEKTTELHQLLIDRNEVLSGKQL